MASSDDRRWALARMRYERGDQVQDVCADHGLARSTLYRRRDREGWRRPQDVPQDQPHQGPQDAPEGASVLVTSIRTNQVNPARAAGPSAGNIPLSGGERCEPGGDGAGHVRDTGRGASARGDIAAVPPKTLPAVRELRDTRARLVRRHRRLSSRLHKLLDAAATGGIAALVGDSKASPASALAALVAAHERLVKVDRLTAGLDALEAEEAAQRAAMAQERDTRDTPVIVVPAKAGADVWVRVASQAVRDRSRDDRPVHADAEVIEPEEAEEGEEA